MLHYPNNEGRETGNYRRVETLGLKERFLLRLSLNEVTDPLNRVMATNMSYRIILYNNN